MRTPTIPWEVEKIKLLDFRARGFSYKKVSEYLYATYGRTVTQARLSQVFNGWKNEETPESLEGHVLASCTTEAVN